MSLMISTLGTFLENFAEIEPFCAGLKKISYEQKKIHSAFYSPFILYSSYLITGTLHWYRDRYRIQPGYGTLL